MSELRSDLIGAPCWVDLATSDLDRAIGFYTDVFGWTAERGDEERYGGYTTFSRDGVAVAGGMQLDGQSPAPDAWTVYLRTDDAEATAERIVAAGGGLIVEPMPIPDLGVMGVGSDVGGAAIGFWEPHGFDGLAVREEPGTPTWFELYTRDFWDVVEFYETVFGWQTRNVGDTDEFRYTVQTDGDHQYAGVMDASSWMPSEFRSHWEVYVESADVDATAARIESLGGTVIQGPEDTPYGRLAGVTDLTGAPFRLIGSRPDRDAAPAVTDEAPAPAADASPNGGPAPAADPA